METPKSKKRGPKPRSLEERFWAKVDRRGDSECWNWTAGGNQYGYGRIHALRPKRKLLQAHRVSFELAHGSIPEGLHVCHRCDNRKCCNPSHMFLGTNIDNHADKVSKGRQARGDRLPQTKLIETDVTAIRCLIRDGVTQKEIASRFSISQSVISEINTNKAWAHLPQLP